MKHWLTAFFFVVASFAHAAGDGEEARSVTYPYYPPAPQFQTWAQADAMSAGCITCHTDSDQKTMHASEAVVLGCADCHGGDPTVRAPANAIATHRTGDRLLDHHRRPRRGFWCVGGIVGHPIHCC